MSNIYFPREWRFSVLLIAGNLTGLLASLGFNQEVPYPYISTKEKDQAFIGLDMNKLKADKQAFMQNVVLKWNELAEKREANWGEKGPP